jgi:hypothetical protein
MIVGAVAVVIVIAAAAGAAGSGKKKHNTAQGISLAPIPSVAASLFPSSVSVPSDTAPASVPASAPASDGGAPAHVGDTIQVQDDDGHNVDITLLKVDRSAHSTDEFDSPSKNHKYWAAEFKLTLSRSADPYDDSPSNGAEAIDKQDQQFDAALVESISSGPLLPAETRIAPGHSARGWLVFEVPKSSTINGVQFGLDSGFGNAAQWIVP